MTSAATQLHFDLQLPAGRPLVPVEVVMVLADRHEDDVLALIETGSLGWAWDLKHPEAQRREIRVWRDSLLDYLRDPNRSVVARVRVAAAAGQDGDEEVMQQLFPHHRAELRSTELQRMFSCSQTHVSDLIAAGLLRESERRDRPASGPQSFRRVTRISVIEMLRARRVV